MLRGQKSDRTPPGWAITVRLCETMNKVIGTNLTPWDLEDQITELWFERLTAYFKKYKEVTNG